MSAAGQESLEHTVQLTHSWIKELDERIGWNDRSYRLLKAVLHALRDWLQFHEAVDLAAQMPTPARRLLRAVAACCYACEASKRG